VVPYGTATANNAPTAVAKFYAKIDKERQDSAVNVNGNQLWIDGLVIKLNSVDNQNKLGIASGKYPKWSTALKFPSPGAITHTTGVELGVGHTGAITPTAIVETVEIGGTNVSRVTLNNWNYIEAMDIAIGDKVKIVKGGDIIPKLVEVLDRPKNRKPIPKPTSCPVCGGKVGQDKNTDGSEAAAIKCKNPDCPAKITSKFERMVKKLEILDIGESIIVAMYKAGLLKKMGDIFRLEQNKTKIAALEVGNGVWGESRTQTMIDEVAKKTTMTLDQFLGMLGIDGLGQRRAKMIIEKADGKMDKIENWLDGTIVEFADEWGVPNIAKPISNGLVEMKNVVNDLLSVVKITAVEKNSTNGVPSFCLTGTLSKKRSEIWDDIRAKGFVVHEDLAKGTTYLVQADPSSESSKSKKAKKYGTKVIGENELNKILGA